MYLSRLTFQTNTVRHQNITKLKCQDVKLDQLSRVNFSFRNGVAQQPFFAVKHNVHYEAYVLQKYELSRVPKSPNLFPKWYNYIQYGNMTNQVTNPKSWTRSTATTSKNFVQAPSIIAKGSKYELIIDFDKARLAMIGIGSAKKY